MEDPSISQGFQRETRTDPKEDFVRLGKENAPEGHLQDIHIPKVVTNQNSQDQLDRNDLTQEMHQPKYVGTQEAILPGIQEDLFENFDALPGLGISWVQHFALA
jgi:hypothetical protein